MNISTETLNSVDAGCAAKVAALKAEVERLRADNEHLETVGESLAQSLDDVKAEAERRRNELTIMLTERLMPLEQENSRLRAALEEYAKKENWGRSRGGYVDRFMPVEENDILGWTVAENALKGGEG